MAREAGLEPLAEVLLARPDQNLQQVACRYVDAGKGVVDPTTALEGARAILVERFAEDATLIGILREEVWSSTPWGLTSTRRPRPCCRESPASAKDWRHSIVIYREAHGPFRTRAVLKKVPRLGPKAFELSAGFLRISNGDDPLDASGVHPEAYPVVRRILAATGEPDRQYASTTPAS
jgi:transcriptional accessory protein Tex/SPT6